MKIRGSHSKLSLRTSALGPNCYQVVSFIVFPEYLPLFSKVDHLGL